MHVDLTLFEADKDLMEDLMSLSDAGRTGEREVVMAGDPAVATYVWYMLYADKAAFVSQLPEKMVKIVVVTVTVCAASRRHCVKSGSCFAEFVCGTYTGHTRLSECVMQFPWMGCLLDRS